MKTNEANLTDNTPSCLGRMNRNADVNQKLSNRVWASFAINQRFIILETL